MQRYRQIKSNPTLETVEKDAEDRQDRGSDGLEATDSPEGTSRKKKKKKCFISIKKASEEEINNKITCFDGCRDTLIMQTYIDAKLDESNERWMLQRYAVVHPCSCQGAGPTKYGFFISAVANFSSICQVTGSKNVLFKTGGGNWKALGVNKLQLNHGISS